MKSLARVPATERVLQVAPHGRERLERRDAVRGRDATIGDDESMSVVSPLDQHVLSASASARGVERLALRGRERCCREAQKPARQARRNAGRCTSAGRRVRGRIANTSSSNTDDRSHTDSPGRDSQLHQQAARQLTSRREAPMTVDREAVKRGGTLCRLSVNGVEVVAQRATNLGPWIARPLMIFANRGTFRLHKLLPSRGTTNAPGRPHKRPGAFCCHDVGPWAGETARDVVPGGGARSRLMWWSRLAPRPTLRC